MGNILEATILIGKFQGEVVLLPRIPIIHSDSPIPFKRLQFLIRLAFAMTIYKSQGQTMKICGLNLENPCFSHGQLYVACSTVGKPSNGYVKSLVYADKPQTLNHLEDNIHRVIADIRPQMLEKVMENWTPRLDYIRASRGSAMPEIIFKM
ncbi:ATP-dependent DNA helicase [Trichonephila clavipes]|nr:ATP-dependent DNA helicase [Trichonephila clavipes]